MSGHMARQNFMATTFAEIAFENFQLMREDYQQLLTLDKICGEVVELEHDMRCKYVIITTFSAMALEAFLNDYGARKLGDNYFYDNYESLPPTAKLQLISQMLFSIHVDKGGIIYASVARLIKERNKLVHSKSKKFTGMSEEEYIEFQQFLESSEYSDEWVRVTFERIDLNEIKELLDNANNAIRSLMEVARFIDKHDPSAYAASKLLCSGWYVTMQREKYEKIRAAQIVYGIEPLNM